VIAPLYGVPIDWDAFSAVARRYGAILIEDAAQGMGALWRGRRLGSLGETATLSFGRGKGWTGGVGGAFLMRNSDRPRAAELATPRFRDQARGVIALLGQWALGRPAVYGIPSSIPAFGLGETVYRPPQPERSLSRTAAGALLASREASELEVNVRKTTANELLAAIAENPRLAAISIERDATPGYLRFPLRVTGGMAAFASQSRALALGISPSYPSSLADLPQLAGRRERSERAWPGAHALVSELVTLPTHSRLRPRELTEIARMLRSL